MSQAQHARVHACARGDSSQTPTTLSGTIGSVATNSHQHCRACLVAAALCAESQARLQMNDGSGLHRACASALRATLVHRTAASDMRCREIHGQHRSLRGVLALFSRKLRSAAVNALLALQRIQRLTHDNHDNGLGLVRCKLLLCCGLGQSLCVHLRAVDSH